MGYMENLKSKNKTNNSIQILQFSNSNPTEAHYENKDFSILNSRMPGYDLSVERN